MNRELIYYLGTRGIITPEIISHPHLSELWQNGFPHLAWQNRSGGVELRNANFKGCKGVKDLTICSGSYSTYVYILEGFIDTLTLFEMWRVFYFDKFGYYPNYYPNVITLNSVVMTPRATQVINACNWVQNVFFILDNDDASKKAYYTLKAGLHSASCEPIIVPYEKDLNALWTSTKKERSIVIDGFINYIFERII